MSKKYFWLKLKDDFFNDIRMKKLRRNAGGATYTVIYLKLQLLSLKNEGILIYEEVEDSFYEEIAFKIDEDPVDVEFTLMFLIKVGLLEEVKQNEFALIETMQSIGSETQAAERVRKHREIKKEQKALQCNTDVTTCNTEIEKEIEKEKDIKHIPEQVQDIEIKFNQFWELYRKKGGRKKSLEKFTKLLKKHSFEEIMEHTKKYMDYLYEKNGNFEYQKHCETFLNNFDLEDVFIVETKNNTNKVFNPYAALENEFNHYKEVNTIENDNRANRIAISENVNTLF